VLGELNTCLSGNANNINESLNSAGLIIKIKRILDSIVDYTVLLLMCALVLVTSSQVFARYVLNNPLIWSEELARYLFIWIVFLSSSIAFRINKHLSVDFVIAKLLPGVKKNIKTTGSIIIAIFLTTIVVISPQIVSVTFMQTSPTLSLPLGFIYLAFPASAVLMLLELLFRVLLVIFNREKSQ
jgi:TRAP-type C4-dicarboxylate transport system permease small subunit